MKPAIVLALNLFILVWPSSHAKKEDCNVRQSSNFAKDAAKAAREIGGKAADSIKEAASFGKEALQGAADMGRAYLDMREANYIGADKYFHARGNSEAAERGPGGKWAAEVISDTREFLQGANKQDSIADQEANRWGRNGGDPNKYRPEGLPDKY